MQKRVEISGEGEQGCLVVCSIGWFSAYRDFLSLPCFRGVLRDDKGLGEP